MIEHIARKFESIKLQEMDCVKLMNRKECKYTLSYNQLLRVLDELQDNYFILTINGKNIMPYKSVYYDMPDFRLYTSHQNGKQNRYKVRSRTYVTTGDRFLELKFKNNKNRTIKKRISIDAHHELSDSKEFLENNLPFSPYELEKKIEVIYERITLVDKSLKERVTIDLNLSFVTDTRLSNYNNLAIIEIKYEGNRRNSKIDKALRMYRIKPLSFSKYCLGISRHFSGVKQNQMNMKIREINKKIYLESLNGA